MKPTLAQAVEDFKLAVTEEFIAPLAMALIILLRHFKSNTPSYGYAVINGKVRLWDYNYRTMTKNNYVSWSSQELERLAREKDAMFDFLEQEPSENRTRAN